MQQQKIKNSFVLYMVFMYSVFCFCLVNCKSSEHIQAFGNYINLTIGLEHVQHSSKTVQLSLNIQCILCLFTH